MLLSLNLPALRSGRGSFNLLLIAANRPFEILGHYSNKTSYDNWIMSRKIIHFFPTLQDSTFSQRADCGV